MIYLQIFFNSLFLTLFATPFFITYMINSGVVDIPGDKRKIHTQITPRMGGLIVFLSSLIIFFTYYEDINSLRLFMLGLITVTICGIFDDIVSLKWNVKFVFQILAVVFLLITVSSNVYVITLFGIALPLSLSYLILFVFALGTINSVNLMDGLDGLVTGYSLIKLFVILVLAIQFYNPILILFLLAFIGSLIGFLKFNAFPARIFLGDTGSLMLGYILVFSSLIISKSISGGVSIELFIPFVLLTTPNFDTIRVILHRLINRSNPFEPDKNHLHHQLLDLGLKQKGSVFLIHFLATLYSLITFIYIFKYKILSVVLYVCLLVFQLFLKDLIGIFIKIHFIVSISKTIRDFFNLFVKFYKFFMMPLSIVALIYFVYIVFPDNMNIYKKYLFTICGFQLIIFLLSYMHNKRSNTLHYIYVFFNITFFLLLIIGGSYTVNRLYNSILTDITLFLTLLYIIVFSSSFIFYRDYYLNKNDHFLSGVDLTIIILIFLSNLLNQVINLPVLKVVGLGLLLSFLIYFWYRIIIVMLPKYEKYLYYISYILPLFVIIIFIIK